MRLSREEVLETFRILNEREYPVSSLGVEFPGYHLNPPLSESEVEAFEKQHQIRLPEDYREFITTVGNGGGGPWVYFHGLNKSSKDLDKETWDEKRIGDLSEPFPFTERWNLPVSFWNELPRWSRKTPREEIEKIEAEARRIVFERYYTPKIMPGAIPLNGHSTLQEVLVVTGSERGHVWEDRRKEQEGVFPKLNPDETRMSFTDWCRNQLQRELARSEWEEVERLESIQRRRIDKRREVVVISAVIGLILAVIVLNFFFVEILRRRELLNISRENVSRIVLISLIAEYLLLAGFVWCFAGGWKWLMSIFVSANTEKEQ